MMTESNLARFVKARGAINAEPTARELQVIGCIAQGLTTAETAKKLFVNIKTVESHRARIKAKLKVRNNVEIARWSLRQAPHCVTCSCAAHT